MKKKKNIFKNNGIEKNKLLRKFNTSFDDLDADFLLKNLNKLKKYQLYRYDLELSKENVTKLELNSLYFASDYSNKNKFDSNINNNYNNQIENLFTNNLSDLTFLQVLKYCLTVLKVHSTGFSH